VAVALKAIEQKVARIKLTKEQLYEKASTIINQAREETQVLMKSGLIPVCPFKAKGRGPGSFGLVRGMQESAGSLNPFRL
jgi:hypothetical protein